MDKDAALFFKLIFWVMAAPFVLVYWIIKGIVFFVRMNHQDRAAANALVAKAEYEQSMQPEVKNETVSQQNTLYGGTSDLEFPAKRTAND